jgi:transcriptional antiterminator RfaH
MEWWYLVQTKPGRERQVAVQIHQRGFVAYLPLIWGSPAKARARRERPYFPGYVFVKLDLHSVGAEVVRWSPGVKGLVEFYGERAHISDDFITKLQQCLDRVRAASGKGLDDARFLGLLPAAPSPFEGYEGMFNLRLVGVDRAQILLACVEQAFWRQTSGALPSSGMPDHSSTMGPSR